MQKKLYVCADKRCRETYGQLSKAMAHASCRPTRPQLFWP